MPFYNFILHNNVEFALYTKLKWEELQNVILSSVKGLNS